MLQSLFAVVRYPAQTWSKDQMWEIMTCCVILHNMIIEDEKKDPMSLLEEDDPYHLQGPLVEPDYQVPPTWAAFIAMRQEIRDSAMHQQLQDDLVEHLWIYRGNTS